MKKILRRVKMNLLKKFGKNLLKCVVFIILFSMLFTSLYIKNIANNLENSIVEKFDIYVQIRKDINNLKHTAEEEQEILDHYIQVINDIAENTNNSYFNFSISEQEYINTLISATDLSNNGFSFSAQSMYQMDSEYAQYKENFEKNRFRALNWYITTSSNVPNHFQLGKNELSSGRFFTDEEISNGDYVCIVPEGYRYYTSNGSIELNAGDTFVISELFQTKDGQIQHYKEHKFTVIGVYDAKTSIDYHIYLPYKTFTSMYDSVLNQINEINYYKNYKLDNINWIYDYALYKFDTIEDFTDFLNYLDNYTDEFNNGYRYTSTMDEIYPAISNILAVSNTITYISYICLFVCVLITLIIVLFEIDYTRKEIGILISMGESIKNIIMQYIFEMIIISLLSASLSFVFTQNIAPNIMTNIAKQSISEEVIQNEIDISIEEDEYQEILRPLTFIESLSGVSIYMLVIFAFQGSILTILIKKVDPKELLKDN